MQKTTRGFIQIPLLLLLILGALVVTVGGFTIKHFSTTPPIQKEQTIATTTENNPCAGKGLDCLLANAQKDSKPDVSPKSSPANNLKPTVEKATNTTPAEPKQDALTIKGELLTKLDSDTSNFTILLDSVRANKEDWIKAAEDAANLRATSLDTLALGVSNSDFKQYLVNDANEYRKNASDARATYTDLYKPVDDVISAQINTTTALREEVWNTLPAQDLQDKVTKLLTDNNNQKTLFLAYAQKANDAAYSVETKKSDYYLQDLDGIRALTVSYATTASVSQQLLKVQQQAQQALTPKEPLQCWITTETQGSIFSNKYTSSIRCNQ